MARQDITMRPPRRWRRLIGCIGLALPWLSGPATAVDSWRLALPGDDLRAVADGALTLMAFTLLPDVTTSSLSIENARTDNPGIWQTTLGGGFTVSPSVPLYLEGTLGYSRYDPEFVASNGAEQRTIPTRWNTFAATGGVGWDFALTDDAEWKLRPIFNFTLGRVATDASIAQAIINDRFDTDFEIVDGGHLDAYGLGGAIMLDYEHYREDYEIDLEVRYSVIQLHTFESTTDALEGRSQTNSTGIWARWRAPTGKVLLQRPLRYVLEFSNTAYFGPQRGALGFDYLTSVGVGIELDSSAYPVVVTRTRLVGRYIFGDNVSGYSLGLAVSF